MLPYKKDYINFMLECEALKFGDFTLKSGRRSPFFMNTGAYVLGWQLRRLGEFYARAINEEFGLDFDVLFGPAYKGIPLAAVTAIAISEHYGREIRYSANRKEVKDHGEASAFLGSEIAPGDRVVIIEDVTTTGQSIAETYPLITAPGDVTVVGLMVSLDRRERGSGAISALEEIKQRYGIAAFAIITMDEVIKYLYKKRINGKVYIDEAKKKAIDDYYKIYGVK
ncbi:MAG: orotate phosphoribosyltransferase [Lachnospiraceae bacterium]|jgi:orotate phosphoribosyltransferase|nr:orotate phosphoribosyltransferase [Lachnospiraceae bacterium]